MEKALQIVQDQLIDNFISHYSIDDSWGLYFGKCYLVAQEIAFEEENLFNNWLEETYPLAKCCESPDNYAGWTSDCKELG